MSVSSERVGIRLVFTLPTSLGRRNYERDNIRVSIDSEKWVVTINTTLPTALVDAIKKIFAMRGSNDPEILELTQKNPTQFILPIISEALDKVNILIRELKYGCGDVLMADVSPFGLDGCFLVDAGGGLHALQWPLALPPLPPFTEKTPSPLPFYARDLVDACTSYFHSNYDDSIRKLVTSLENYFSHYKVHAKKKSFFGFLGIKRKTKFSRQVTSHVTTSNYRYKEKHLKVIRENVMYVYKLRNLIVHANFRSRPDMRTVCKKAIGTMTYVYQSNLVRSSGLYEYCFAVQKQLVWFDHLVRGPSIHDLMEIRRQAELDIDGSGPASGDMDEFVFKGLRISEKDKKSHGLR